MSIKTYKPTTPSRRHMSVSGFDGVDKHAKPQKELVEVLKKHSGRNSYGRITVRHRGGGNKKKYRIIDFKRQKLDVFAEVKTIEYDPNRTARIALLRAALGSVADRAIIPMPDWLGLGAEAHLNTPGKLGGNWTWRAAEGFDAEPLASRIQAECEVYCRAKEPVEKEAKTSI